MRKVLIPFVLGLPLLIFGMKELYQVNEFVKRGAHADGIIVDMQRGTSILSKYHPRVRDVSDQRAELSWSKRIQPKDLTTHISSDFPKGDFLQNITFSWLSQTTQDAYRTTLKHISNLQSRSQKVGLEVLLRDLFRYLCLCQCFQDPKQNGKSIRICLIAM